MNTTNIAKTGIGLVVIACIAFLIFKISGDDYSSSPDKETLEREFSRFQDIYGGPSEYFNKVMIKGYHSALVASSDTRDISIRMAETAKANGWTLRAKRETATASSMKFCKGRLALALDVQKSGERFQYGIYWTSDRNNSLYCSP